MLVNGRMIEPYSNLQGSDLWGAELRRANLRDADLRRANLRDADLQGAELRRANLRDADLRRANLQGVDLQGADLRGSDLRGSDLRGANLRGADLRDADLQGADLPHFQICPEVGPFVGWKKLAFDKVAKLLIPNDAERTSTLVGRKCRASKVLVLEGGGESLHDGGRTRYRQGRYIHPDKYDGDIRVACTHGIHFFMTRKEAEEY